MVEQAVRLGSVLPRWTYRGENGFELEITAIPKTPGTRGLSDIQPIGSLPPEVRWGGGSAALRNSLKGKMTKYGKSDIPFVVAVNALSSWGTSREDALEALIRPSEERSMSETLWNHTKNTRVSGVIVARAFPWNVLGTTLCFYHNPFAKRPCFYPWRIPQMIMKGSTPEWIEGCDSTELFK